MRFHRSKLTRKYLKFYRIVFGLNSPYDILLDGNFIFSSIKYKIELKDTLSKLLQGLFDFTRFFLLFDLLLVIFTLFRYNASET